MIFASVTTREENQPVYEVPPPKYSAERILRILLDPHIPDNRVCKKKPVNIKKSSTFVVDTRNLKSLDDIKKDDFEIWSYSGSHPQSFRIHHEDEDEDIFTVQLVLRAVMLYI